MIFFFFYCLHFGAPLRIATQEFWVPAGPTETEPSYDMLVVNRSRETYVCRGQARLGLTTPVFTSLSISPRAPLHHLRICGCGFSRCLVFKLCKGYVTPQLVKSFLNCQKIKISFCCPRNAKRTETRSFLVSLCGDAIGRYQCSQKSWKITSVDEIEASPRGNIVAQCGIWPLWYTCALAPLPFTPQGMLIQACQRVIVPSAVAKVNRSSCGGPAC